MTKESAMKKRRLPKEYRNKTPEEQEEIDRQSAEDQRVNVILDANMDLEVTPDNPKVKIVAEQLERATTL